MAQIIWKTLYRSNNLLTIHCLKGLLAQSNIEVEILGEALVGAMGDIPIPETEIRLQVQPHHFKKAQSVIDQFESDSGSIWFCRKCKEENTAAFEICWHCNHDPATE